MNTLMDNAAVILQALSLAIMLSGFVLSLMRKNAQPFKVKARR